MNTNKHVESAWKRFLDGAFEGDTADIERLQLALHEAVHGPADARPIIVIWSAERASGKSTLVRALRKALADSSIIFRFDVREHEVPQVLADAEEANVRVLGEHRLFARPARAVVAGLDNDDFALPEGPRVQAFELAADPDLVLGDLDAELDLIREWATGIPAESRAA